MLGCRTDAADQFLYLKNFGYYSQAGSLSHVVKTSKTIWNGFFPQAFKIKCVQHCSKRRN